MLTNRIIVLTNQRHRIKQTSRRFIKRSAMLALIAQRFG